MKLPISRASTNAAARPNTAPPAASLSPRFKNSFRMRDRVAPNAIIQGGRRIGDEARFPHPEVGTWPHVRGVLGLSMPDTNDAQFFVDLVDNPRFDHQYTVFAQILNGADVVDQLLEGDVIESITITL